MPFHLSSSSKFMIYSKALSLLLLLLLSSSLSAESAFLKLEGSADSAQVDKDGKVEITGPGAVLATPVAAVGNDHNVIELEYFCIGGVPEFDLLPGPPFGEATSRSLPAMGHSEGWTSYSARIAPKGKSLPAGWKQLRLELPLKPSQSIQIRNVRLRAENPGEFDPQVANTKASASKGALERYLSTAFPGKVSEVTIGKDYIHIEGNTGGAEGVVSLADIPMDIILDDARSWQTTVDFTPADDGSFSLEVPRFRKRGGLNYDRLTSRWQIVRKTDSGMEPLSHARYGGSVETRGKDLPPANPKNKKGLGGWHLGRLPGELDELGISAVTVNIALNGLVALNPAKDTVPVEWQGYTFHIRQKAIERFDQTFIEAAKRGAMVSTILLIPNPAKHANQLAALMGHPDAVKEGIYGMPNVTSAKGLALYGAVLNFMAERWSRPDGKFGRVHHWIAQNEVDAGWVWTNVGDKPDVVYMDLYHRSMRVIDLIVRQYDPGSRAFITLTHHWAESGNDKWYGSRRMLELLAMYEAAEGEFPWGLAYHPYPQNLRNPRTWEDHQATFSFDSKKITPHNLEVLDAYMKQPKMLFQGQVRPVHLSENGFNSPDYSPKSLEDQAAGMALAWAKMRELSSIESWQYHNWIDNRQEGGLRIGLRKFPDAEGDPYGKKPIWHLYKAMGTAQEEEAMRPYLKTIGISSWDEVIHKEAIK